MKSLILCYFVAVMLKVLLVNLLAALNFANVFLKIKNVWKIKNVKNVKNVTKNLKKTFVNVIKNVRPTSS